MRTKLIMLSLLLVDICITAAVPFMAMLIRFEGNISNSYLQVIIANTPIFVAVRISIFYFFGLYHRLWRYAGINEMIVIIGAVTCSSLLLMVYTYLSGDVLPRSIHILSWLMNTVFIGASRISLRVVHHLRQRLSEETVNVLIIGAGDAGAVLARELLQREDKRKIIGFVDDDVYKHNKMLNGIKVLGARKDISAIIRTHFIKEIIIAMPSAGGAVIRETVQVCRQTGCLVTILPGIYELVDGKVTVQQLRKVNLEDLLRRDAVSLDTEGLQRYLSGKRVLVTGAGGSIGSELCRQIAKFNPDLLVLLGKGENSIYEIHRELQDCHLPFPIEPVIADVRDQDRIRSIFSQYKPQVVFHAAAHKHVPLMEAQPEEAVHNNVFGTKTVADVANEFGAETFIMISTDKAVNPTSVMGATKRAAELVVQHMNSISRTKFAAVRFGNVLGSRGSVVPLFRKQIAAGGPITITHSEMKRYFMTIPEATQLVLQAGALAHGGEVFVLDMGEPVKIVDMACDLIQLSGLIPFQDIKIEFTGLRPGEKLFEELLTAEEGTSATRHQKIFTANLHAVDGKHIQHCLLALYGATHRHEVTAVLDELIPSYAAARKKHCIGADGNAGVLEQKQQSATQAERQSAVT
ncbi:polysaccharide biosynthesis protein [Anaerosporomusa subterranea]|uniref:Polysaccharide biosynthesis protein n=1 Tax=Anaerosporomusa subterranea TaxID=1794912 RepID=A0A154BR73_ANASB|nr:nucleoside-diphosphate sugar epimerase/dehydratase [Anaerosporomusa subterranea]KYZ76436.1 polysaccharide biosynthesis protein [Anaerosporomusa subterranea]